MTKFPDLFAALAAPFESHEIKTRSQQGRQLHYITARTAMNRLDNVLGPESWWDEYVPSENSVLCRLTIRLPDGSTLTKADAGGYAGLADSGDDDKSGYSDAFKRACVKFGVSRYLYRDGVPNFVQERCGEVQESPATAPAAPQGRPQPPDAPPTQERPGTPQEGSQGHSRAPYEGPDRPPASGKALFAWTKKQEELHGEGLIKYLNGWGKLQEFPFRMVEWDAEQVKRAHTEAVRKLQSVGKSDGERPSARDEDRPGQFPDNQSGYGRGQYASPDQVDSYRAFVRQLVEDRNQAWLDSWTTDAGTLTDGIGEYLRTFQVTNHMLKFGLRTGRLADVGVAYDPETGKPVDAVSTEKAEKYVAILYHRHREGFLIEADRYASEAADAAEDDWRAKHDHAESGSRN